MQATPDSWLVIGAHTATVTMSEGEEVAYRLALTPLRSGALTMPGVRISLAATGDGEETMQTEVRSKFRTVTVVEDLTSTTVALGAGDVLGERVEVVEAGAA